MKYRSLPPMYTILDILRWTSSKLNAAPISYGHGTNNFWDEALHLVLPTLHLPINIPTEMYYAHLTKKELSQIIKLINYRIYQHIPVPYLTNIAWFCGLKFYVDQRVFIPRSPIGEIIISHFYKIISHPPMHVLDMCTGSGSIAIAIAMNYPNIVIDAVDTSIDALKIATHNIQLYDLEDRIYLIHSNLFDNIPQIKYDLIITNPPYISKLNMSKLPKEFHHEPIISLNPGYNGLEIIQRILKYSVAYLNKNGILICEVGIAKKSLVQSYPDIPFNWITFTNGGSGVFSLTYKQLSHLHKKYTIHH